MENTAVHEPAALLSQKKHNANGQNHPRRGKSKTFRRIFDLSLQYYFPDHEALLRGLLMGRPNLETIRRALFRLITRVNGLWPTLWLCYFLCYSVNGV